MSKKKCRTYAKVKVLNVSEIQEKVIDLLSSNEASNYWDELNYKLDSFSNLINSVAQIKNSDNMYSVPHDEVQSTIISIINCVKKYLFGDINSAYNTFYYRWNYLTNNKFTEGSSIYTLPANSSKILFKIRNSDTPLTKKTDFFHISFKERGKIGNNRFSISGYPCLYLGQSIYSCWEETRQPHIDNMWAVGYKITKSIHLLDLRLKQNIDTGTKEADYIMLLPYIIASSIKTHSDSDTFKPEYIIPQLLLHSVVKKRGYYQYDGIVYTSTRRGIFNDLELCSNYAIPVMSNKYSTYCKKLAGHFIMTNPISCEAELMKGSLNASRGYDSYENSLFHHLEDVLASSEFGNIL